MITRRQFIGSFTVSVAAAMAAAGVPAIRAISKSPVAPLPVAPQRTYRAIVVTKDIHNGDETILAGATAWWDMEEQTVLFCDASMVKGLPDRAIPRYVDTILSMYPEHFCGVGDSFAAAA